MSLFLLSICGFTTVLESWSLWPCSLDAIPTIIYLYAYDIVANICRETLPGWGSLAATAASVLVLVINYKYYITRYIVINSHPLVARTLKQLVGSTFNNDEQDTVHGMPLMKRVGNKWCA